jgi:hypothetical protein
MLFSSALNTFSSKQEKQVSDIRGLENAAVGVYAAHLLMHLRFIDGSST